MNEVPTIAGQGGNNLIETNVTADQETLRAIRQFLIDSPTVSRAEFEPICYELLMVRAYVADELCPSSRSFEIEIQWFLSGGFSIDCLETSQDTDWWCRWERYRHMDATPARFHSPPDGEQVEDLVKFPDHPLEVVATVIIAVEKYLCAH